MRNRSRVVRRGSFPAAICALAVALSSLPALAQELDIGAQLRVLTLRLSTSTTWDANVFRLPDSAPDPQLLTFGRSGKSDRITTTTLGLSIDKAYAQQRFNLDVSQAATRHANFTDLNFDSLSYNGSWAWTLTPRVTGNLSAVRSESQIPFTDLSLPQRNVRVSNTRSFNLDGWLFGGWHALASASNSVSETSQVYLAQPGSRTNSGSLGLSYVTRSGNSITATTSSTRGANTKVDQAVALASSIPNDFSVRQDELKATWNVSGKSSLSGRLARSEQINAGISGRDFSGTNASLNYAWAVDGRLTYNLSVSRNTAPWTADTQASYKVDDTFSFAPSMQIGKAITLHMNMYRAVSDYLGPVAPLIGPPRRDILRSVQLGVDWSPPMGYLRIAGSIQRDQRSSSVAGADFGDTVGMLSASLSF